MFGILNTNKGQKIKGTVVLMPKNVLDFNAIVSVPKGSVLDAPGKIIGGVTGIVGGVVDTATAFLGRNVSMQLISATKTDAGGKGQVGKETFLSSHLPRLPTLGARQDAFSIFFEFDANFGIPGAFYIRNYTSAEFFLVSVTLEDIPNHGSLQFVCNSWIYNFKSYSKDRIFFTNDTYLPSQTPDALTHFRKEELLNLRGNGTGERKVYDRIYDYDVYNDLGNPDSGDQYVRPVLGGSSTYPYPRRVRSGRKSTRKG